MYPTIFTREKEELPRTDEGITIGIATGSVVTRQNNYSARQFASWAFCHCLQAFSSLKPLSLCPSCELKKGVPGGLSEISLFFTKTKNGPAYFGQPPMQIVARQPTPRFMELRIIRSSSGLCNCPVFKSLPPLVAGNIDYTHLPNMLLSAYAKH